MSAPPPLSRNKYFNSEEIQTTLCPFLLLFCLFFCLSYLLFNDVPRASEGLI